MPFTDHNRHKVDALTRGQVPSRRGVDQISMCMLPPMIPE